MLPFTRSDLRHIEETRSSLREGCSWCNPDIGCDCCFSETVMLSFGYYEVLAYLDEGEEEILMEVNRGTY